MKAIDDGGSAFPLPAGCGNDLGMSLRDYFAAKALQGFCNRMSPDDVVQIADGVLGGHTLTRAALALADALLEDRAK